LGSSAWAGMWLYELTTSRPKRLVPSSAVPKTHISRQDREVPRAGVSWKRLIIVLLGSGGRNRTGVAVGYEPRSGASTLPAALWVK